MCRSWTGRLLWLLGASLIPSLSPAQSGAPTGQDSAQESGQDVFAALDAAIASNDDKQIAGAHKEVLLLVQKNPVDLRLRLAAARGYVARADLLRIERHTGKVKEKTAEKYRAQQAEWGEAGSGHASEALAVADSKQEKATAYRLRGEATVHRIDGMFAGLRFGPEAKSDLEKALELDAEDPEAQRAYGLMYLHNPPINGGDLEKAVETFKHCIQLRDTDVYHALLAQAWMKRERYERATLEARLALKRNKNNRLARNIKARIEEEKER